MSIQTVAGIRVERLIERIKQRDVMTYPGDDPKLGLPPIGFNANFLVPIFRDRVNEEFADFYDVAPDGRFLLMETVEPPAPARIDVIFDWFSELERLVPAGR